MKLIMMLDIVLTVVLGICIYIILKFIKFEYDRKDLEIDKLNLELSKIRTRYRKMKKKN